VLDSSSSGAVLPEQFGKYALLGHLATGGMAEVWLARQLGLEGFEKIVVIKRARPELTDPATIHFLLDEARLVATLEHPNIAQVHEIGVVNGAYFFVMEYVPGADLRRLIQTSLARSRPVPLGDAMYIVSHVCTALHYAHEKRDLDGRPLQLVHRDVSPSNVLISHDGAIKVCDFGIAKASNRRAEATQAGVLKGKFSYMSPEQCQSHPIDRRSDVFSIGILLYELTTLSQLFRAHSEYALLQSIIESPIPPPSARVLGYPRELEAIVMKALAKSPNDRYQTAQEMQVDLETFAREHKLAMSSISVAKLMGSLFDRRSDARIRAQRPVSESGATPSARHASAFIAAGSIPSAADLAGAATSVLGAQGSAVASRQTQPSVSSRLSQVAPRPPTASLWLVGAAIAGVAAIGVTVAERLVASAGDRSGSAALGIAAERIASTFDAAASGAHLRGDGIATTPVLRAAIATDAATIADLAKTEMLVGANKGEALEIFQFHGDKPVSLLRIPSSAPPLPALKGRETKLRIDGRDATVFASAPIIGYEAKLGGGLVISAPVDLSAIRRFVEENAVDASLVGLGNPLVLAGTGAAATGAATLRIPVPSRGEWNAAGAMLVATPRAVASLSWAGPARYAFGGFAGLLVLGFVVVRVRRPRS